MEIRDDLYYTETHEWIHLDGEIATIGISDFAQHELGDIVFVEAEKRDKVAPEESLHRALESLRKQLNSLGPSETAPRGRHHRCGTMIAIGSPPFFSGQDMVSPFC